MTAAAIDAEIKAAALAHLRSCGGRLQYGDRRAVVVVARRDNGAAIVLTRYETAPIGAYLPTGPRSALSDYATAVVAAEITASGVES